MMLSTIILAIALIPGDAPKPTLPTDWDGEWKGKLQIMPLNGEKHETVMELHIAPMKVGKGYSWKIIYGEGKKQQARNYELIPQEKANHFVIDEKNGLLIDSFLVGSTMHSQFQVADSLIPVRYELKGEILTFSLASYATKDARTTKLAKGEFDAIAFKLEAVQVAELRKAK